MFGVIFLLAIIVAFLTAYTMSVQGTTLARGRLLVSKSIQFPDSGVQDAITPKRQTIRNILMFSLFLIVVGLTTYAYAWYDALLVLLVTFLTSSILPTILRMKPVLPRLVSVIASDIKRRHQSYLDKGVTVRAQAIEDLLGRLRQLSPEEILQETHR